ncbi:phosphatidate cytidylyltransferase [Microbacterium horticulturae]|uniref:Phosphatidate cytidylyltransferase n=1 Tax=Microbacterium horticulturae TaxID=3028316 RepID=A0ABY8C2S2_9MICO|nr:phosphatidate cytidylyltransferase [Microbacterium sp. KACC 23027]WEG10595.1 phosphatidate cytidylyltransferase [Microbacterium sp. KACC 23027]
MTDASEQPPDGRGRRRGRRSRARAEIDRARADFDHANERIKQRTGRDLIGAIVIGLVIGIALLLSLLIWKPVFILFVLAAAGTGIFEFGRALQAGGRRIDLAPQLVGMLAMVASAWFLPLWEHWVVVCAAVVLVVVWRLVAAAAGRRRTAGGSLWQDVLAGVLVQLYVPFTGSLAIILLRQASGELWVLAFIVLAIVADTSAYATGLTLGKHPMAPRVSPKKTWEGFAGAVVGAVIAGILLSFFMLGLPWATGIIFGLVILFTATIGDLGESMIKRDLGIKDMSSWLPGHGGVLDRLDSILPSAGAALALYYLLTPLVTQ